MKVLVVTNEWPSAEYPARVPFLVRQVELLRSRGILVHVFHFEGKRNLVNYLKAFLNIRKHIKAVACDVVHVQWGQSAFPVLFTQLPVVVTFRGSDLYGIIRKNGTRSFRGWLLTVFSRAIVSRRAKAIIIVSERMRKLLPRSVSDRITVLPSGINFKLFKPMDKILCRRELGLPLESKLVLFAGNPRRTEKQYPLAKEAVEKASLEMEVKLIEVLNVPHSIIPIYLNAADVVLLTSSFEGSPNIIKEAMACNRPIISVEVGDVAERLKGAQGTVLAERSSDSLAMAILKLLRNELDPNTRPYVEELDDEILTDRLIEIYKRASPC
jgi:glycosyltransferase involved in cell wall biosynthesis